ncbi:MAG TPA: bifunctional DNA-binding transcriptional regulator/O6-methylguanine-DNA methyltransferase Ada [Chthonomonadaceae bacterium]|nr:bifunctional DNA-binding transcriptional regulator/O6-methylguanine-DNA methyltransferase Ada [Chthonomonadaceae bacterium]
MSIETTLSQDSFLPSEECWMAVEAHDARADGKFVYAVRSTGIYCRPSCPSKRPAREQVRFYASPQSAERAGFRACRRCRPQEAARQALAVETVCVYIQEHLEEALDLKTLGAHVEMSPAHLQRVFKQRLGLTPREYADACRLERFKARVKEGEPITGALFEAGYSSSSRLYERAATRLGMTPGAYRKGGKGMRIGYTITDCPLGRLLVAATEKGLCAVSIGETDAGLEAMLKEEYPAASLARDEAALASWIQAVQGYWNGDLSGGDLPLDVQATAFQWRVWRQLQAIPFGSAVSYGQVARALGEPNAVRAVAQACAANRVALVIPCHRVVRENGAPGGYRWGLARKQALLEHEKATARS